MIESIPRILILHPDDSVALCLSALGLGDVAQAGAAAAREAIPAGHKIALRAMAKGDAVIKYGQAIGLAAEDISPGAHVHVHNVTAEVGETKHAGATTRSVAPARRAAAFQGFVRPDGRVATRNYIGVIASVNCSATVARRIADFFPAAMFEGDAAIDGVCAFTHATGCGMADTGEGADILARTLGGYARHANFAGVLIVGLGCEVMQIDTLMDRQLLSQGPELRRLSIQEAGGTLAAIEAGRAIVRELIDQARGQRRETVSAAHLTLGLQCGGSDGLSGVTANPALGRAADRLVAAGGTVILSETPEIHGAEQLLLDRAVSDAVRGKLHDRLAWWRDYAARHGASLNNNPSPGNLKGGITTILEKSLGAVAKSGSAPLQDVRLYAEPAHGPGFVFMDSPGYDPCSATGQIAAGANILAFTTGRGSVFGSKPAPCIKLATNSGLALHMAEDMDVDCSPVIEGRSLDAMGDEIFERLLRVASGEPSKSESLGVGDLEFVPWQIGAVL